MAAGEYLTGLGLLALVVGAAISIAVAIVRRRLPALAGLERWLAGSLLATAALIAINLLPAALGILERWSVALAAAGALAAAVALLRGPSAQVTARRPPGDRAPSPISVALAAVAVAAVAVYAVAILARLGGSPATFIDTVTFHLPGAASWIQSQSIWQIDQFLPGQAQGYYPGNGNVVQLAAMLPWDSDFLIRLVNLPFYALAGIALYASGRELGAPWTSAAIAAAAAMSVPAMTSYIVDSPTPDAVMYATFATGVFFLLRHAHSESRADLLLAGLGLGIAFGSRWYGVSSVAVVVAVWLLAQTVARRWNRRLGVDAAWLLATIGAAGGIWLIRNWVEAGNPVFPVEVSALGVTLFDAPRDVVRELVGFSISDYLGDSRVIDDFIVPGLRIQLGWVGAAFAIFAAAAALLAFRERRRQPDGFAALALVAAALLLTVAYAITPYTALGLEGLPYELGANVRYLVPALLVAAPAVAWAIGRAGRLRPLGEGVLVAVALDAIRRGVDVSLSDALLGVIAVAGLALLAIGLAAAARRGRSAIVAAGAAVVVLGATALYALEERFIDGRYAGASFALDAALEAAPPDAEIGVAGAWPVTTLSPVLALMGPRFENEVSYVGEWRDGMLLPLESRDSFAEALERGDFDLVMIGKEKPLAFPQRPEEQWALDAGYREIAADENFAVLAPADRGDAS
jgi:hypothetical protein